MSQPLEKAGKVARVGTRFRETTGNIAAIDFGTTFCSLAYITKEEGTVITLKSDNTHQRIPTAILLKRDGPKPRTPPKPGEQTPVYRVVDAGYDAQRKYVKMRPDLQKECLYFQGMKMMLHHDKNVHREMTVDAFNGDKYYLVEVIAFILKFFKDRLMDRLRPKIKVTDIDWVITVPAIWQAKGKQMMRQAAYLAGLCSDTEGITTFTVYGRGIAKPKEENADHLSLVLEPDAAAIYCQTTKKSDYCTDSTTLGPSNSYLVLDIGGGTVDITTHKLDQHGNVQVIEIPDGNAWGGTQVNRQFSLLLQKIVGDPIPDPKRDHQDPTQDQGFAHFLASGDETQRRIRLNEILNKEFEDAKVAFGEKAHGTGAPQDDEEAIVELRHEFVSCYGNVAVSAGVANLNDDQIVLDGQNSLCISYTRMESLFQPAIEGIINGVLPILEKHKGIINVVYLVGGFGGCKYVYEKLKTAIDAKFKKGTFSLVVPYHHRLAVVQGAVLYRQRPELIQSRRIDATYGIEVATQFDPTVHKTYCREYDDQGIPLCRNIFLVFAQKGEIVKAEEVFETTVHPEHFAQNEAEIEIYCTEKVGVHYTVDETGKATVRKIGNLIVKLPNPDRLQRLERPIKVFMDFSGPEIQTKAIYDIPGAKRIEVSVTIDLLSSLPQ